MEHNPHGHWSRYTPYSTAPSAKFTCEHQPHSTKVQNSKKMGKFHLSFQLCSTRLFQLIGSSKAYLSKLSEFTAVLGMIDFWGRDVCL